MKDVVLVPAPWESAMEAPVHSFFPAHTPVGATTARAGTADDLRKATVVVLAWDPEPEDGSPGDRPESTAGGLTMASLRTLVRQLDEHAHEAVLVLATEPLDPLTTIVGEASRRPSHRVLGIGTLPDTLCFQTLLAEYYSVDPRSVYVLVLGAHALAEVPLWSQALIGGHHIVREELFGTTFDADRMWDLFHAGEAAVHRVMECEADEPRSTTDAETEDPSRSAAQRAVSCAVRQVVESILRDERRVLPVSALLEGTFGVSGVCLSLPCVVGRHGVEGHTIPHLADDEKEAFVNAAATVREAIRSFGVEHASDPSAPALDP